MKSIKKKNAKDNEIVKWAGLIVLLLLLLGGGSAGAWYMMQPDPTTPVLNLQEELFSDQARQLPREQRTEKWKTLREETDKLTPEQRHKVLAAREEKMSKRASEYCALTTQEERDAFLQKEIEDDRARREKWQSQQQANGGDGQNGGRRGRGQTDPNANGGAPAGGTPPAGGPPPGGPPGGPGGFGGPGGRMNEQQRDDRYREHVQAVSPEQRGQMQQYRYDKQIARQAQGLPPQGGGRGFGPR
jgi:hypothetical protein